MIVKIPESIERKKTSQGDHAPDDIRESRIHRTRDSRVILGGISPQNSENGTTT
jgi:hypothetical protein